jgi:adenine-specific DNA methylase
MTPFLRPSLLEAGLPCSSLSAECQRDNNARVRPPQNRLHVWWARRPPTVCRAALLSALLPHDVSLDEAPLPKTVSELSAADLDRLPARLVPYRNFFAKLLAEVGPTPLSPPHAAFLRALGIRGDPEQAQRRMARRTECRPGDRPILLPQCWTYRHPPAFGVSPTPSLVRELLQHMRDYLALKPDEPLTLLDPMAGGGSIPLEGVRYGLRVFANDLNPVAALVLKATLEYPSRFGQALVPTLWQYATGVAAAVRERLLPYFPTEPGAVWWPAEKERAERTFTSRGIVARGPAPRDSSKNCYLWCRTIPCPGCGLNIPLSTNFHLATGKNGADGPLAVFPEVPPAGQNDCTFRIVGAAGWAAGRWHPRNTPTFCAGRAECPRCGCLIDEASVKRIAQVLGGLPIRLMAVGARVPVQLTWRGGKTTIRYLWRFRAPAVADQEAVRAAEEALAAADTHRTASQEIPAVMEDRRPREYGMTRWQDFFSPRQLLANGVLLEEVRAAAARARAELPADRAEAVAVYLAFLLSKVVNYNSVSSSWHDGRKQIRGTMMGHDFRFHPCFAEMEMARETVQWAATQVIDAYADLAGLIHGDAGIRPDVIVPAVSSDDAAALRTPQAGTVHLVCVDPPYYGNVQYAELSNFFHVWLKQALGDTPGLEYLFRDELAPTAEEAVASVARCKEEAERFYQEKMTVVFRRARHLLHPAGRMVVLFNHKTTRAWRALGQALLEAGFEVRSSTPIHTEAESSLNIRGLDAARCTVLLLCLPRQQSGQPAGNWDEVRQRIAAAARQAAAHGQEQGLCGTDLYLAAFGPALREAGRHGPITRSTGEVVDLGEALEEAYRAVGRFRREQILAKLSDNVVDRDTQALWLWLDAIHSDVAGAAEVRKLARSLDLEADGFRKLALIRAIAGRYRLQRPGDVDLAGAGFLGAAVWQGIGRMSDGAEALECWLRDNGYDRSPPFRKAFAVTLGLLERAFGERPDKDGWKEVTRAARRAWQVVVRVGHLPGVASPRPTALP